MKVLFVSSGNSASGISPIVKAQAKSLADSGIDIETFGIMGKGIIGYLKNIPRLKQKISRSNPVLIHAHYSFCGMVSSLASRKPVICSLMGSDVNSSGVFKIVINFFMKCFWRATIVKSSAMGDLLSSKQPLVVPNGVNLDIFKPRDKRHCRELLNLPLDKTLILFAADPGRPEKNYPLAKEAVSRLNKLNTELLVVHGVPQIMIAEYLNAVDVVLLTSLWEGSPNIIKEAMACNCCIVSTDVGDVSKLLKGVSGSKVSAIDVNSIAESIRTVLESVECDKYSNGRTRLQKLALDSVSVAQRLLSIYKDVTAI